MANKYIVAKHIFASGVNFENSYITDGISILGMFGFLGALQDYINKNYAPSNPFDKKLISDPVLSSEKDSIGIIVHNQNYTEGKGSPENKNPRKMASEDGMLMNLEGQVLLSIVFKVDISSEVSTSAINELVRDFFLGCRFLGGRIENAIDADIATLPDEDAVKEFLGKTFWGWVPKDATSKLNDLEDELGVEGAIFEIYALTEDKDKNYTKKLPGWYFLSLHGYYFLMEPSKKDNARNGLLHTCFEPILSLHEWRYLHGKTAPYSDAILWRREETDFGITLTQSPEA